MREVREQSSIVRGKVFLWIHWDIVKKREVQQKIVALGPVETSREDGKPFFKGLTLENDNGYFCNPLLEWFGMVPCSDGKFRHDGGLYFTRETIAEERLADLVHEMDERLGLNQ